MQRTTSLASQTLFPVLMGAAGTPKPRVDGRGRNFRPRPSTSVWLARLEDYNLLRWPRRATFRVLHSAFRISSFACGGCGRKRVWPARLSRSIRIIESERRKQQQETKSVMQDCRLEKLRGSKKLYIMSQQGKFCSIMPNKPQAIILFI